MQKKYNILFGSKAKNIFFSIYNSLCDYKMHYGKIMNEVMIIVKFATSKLGILYSWLCFFKPSNCHHQGLFAFGTTAAAALDMYLYVFFLTLYELYL